MIETIAQLLNEFKEVSLEKINRDDSDITHRPTIGNIFEGLTSELLEQAVFKGLNLKVVRQSFIYNEKNNISDEIDCMLVSGDGKHINFTNQYKYHISQVIAVIQVKKKLYANDIVDSHHNLHSVFRLRQDRLLSDGEKEMFYDAFRLLNSKPPPNYEDLHNYSAKEQLSYSTLLLEAVLPARIVFGYFGYKNEYELRNGFINKVENLLNEQVNEGNYLSGFSPATFPNLIICNNISIVKNNGMPFGIPFSDNKFFWEVLTSSTGDPIKNLLEIIWTKLSYKFGISSKIFGDDFSIEQTHPFLACTNKKIKGHLHGWDIYYHELSKNQLEIPLTSTPWKPVEINPNLQVILLILGSQGSIDIENDEEFLDYIQSHDLIKEEIIDKLVSSRLVYIENNQMRLLTDNLNVVNTPDGKIFAGDDKNGELQQFLLNYLEKKYK